MCISNIWKLMHQGWLKGKDITSRFISPCRVHAGADREAEPVLGRTALLVTPTQLLFGQSILQTAWIKHIVTKPLGNILLLIICEKKHKEFHQGTFQGDVISQALHWARLRKFKACWKVKLEISLGLSCQVTSRGFVMFYLNLIRIIVTVRIKAAHCFKKKKKSSFEYFIYSLVRFSKTRGHLMVQKW